MANDRHRFIGDLTDNQSKVVVLTMEDLEDNQRKKESLNSMVLNVTGKSTEIHHIGFLKVHKAGSSTMQNIFFRFGLKQNLTFLIPSNSHIFNAKNAMPLKSGAHYDIIAVHSTFKKAVYDTILPPDKVNLAIVREPLQRMISAAYYYRDVFGVKYLKNVPKENFITELIMHSDKYNSKLFSATNNQMGKDFGFSSPTDYADANAILEKLNFLDKEFKLVLVMERFDESLILMKRYLNWKISEILYIPSNSHTHPKLYPNETEKSVYRNASFLDYAIYDYFTKRFEYKVDAEGSLFHDEVKQFQVIQEQVKAYCNRVNRDGGTLKVSASVWNEPFLVAKSDCELMKLGEIPFVNKLRKRHELMHGSGSVKPFVF